MSGTTTASSASGTATKYTPAQNLADRATLIATGIRVRANLGTFGGYTAGSRASIKLRNVGVLTGIMVRVTANVTITAAMTESPLGPWGLLSKVEFSDYNTTLRVSTSNILLYMVNSIRHGRPWSPVGQGLVDTNQTVVPTAIGTNVTLQFSIYVPLAVDPHRDLSGSILAQTVVGEQYLNLTVNPNFVGDATSAYTAGTGTLNSVSFDVWQDYIQPQTAALPLMDLNTVYELAGNFVTTSNVQTNGQCFLDYPNVRIVKALYAGLIDNGTVTPNGTDINTLTQIANGNTNMREEDPLLVRMTMREMLGGDLPAGLYYIGNRSNPISTFIYSQVQERFTFNALTGNSYLFYGFESTYANNTPLPGIAAGG